MTGPPDPKKKPADDERRASPSPADDGSPSATAEGGRSASPTTTQAEDTSHLRLANEAAVASLFEALSTDKALAVATDEASDNPETLAPYGLAIPEKTLLVHTTLSPRPLVLDLGTRPAPPSPPSPPNAEAPAEAQEDQYFARLRGTPTVLRVDPFTYRKVATAPHEWKDTLLWQLPLSELTHLVIQPQGKQPLFLDYDFLAQSWSAHLGEQDRTPSLNQARANRYLDFLESLRVRRWLSPDSLLAQSVFERPVFRLAARLKPDAQHPEGRTLALQLARGPRAGKTRLFYLRTNASPYPAVIDLPTARRLATDLFEK